MCEKPLRLDRAGDCAWRKHAVGSASGTPFHGVRSERSQFGLEGPDQSVRRHTQACGSGRRCAWAYRTSADKIDHIQEYDRAHDRGTNPDSEVALIDQRHPSSRLKNPREVAQTRLSRCPGASSRAAR